MTGYIGPKCHFWVFYRRCRKRTSGRKYCLFDLFWWRVEHAVVANRSLPLELGNAIAHGASWVSKRQTDSHTWWRWRKGGCITSNFRFARRGENIGFSTYFGAVSVPQSLPMAIEAKRGVNLRIWDAVGWYGARGRCLVSRSHS